MIRAWTASLLTAILLIACEERQASPTNDVVIPQDAPDEESWNTSLLFTDSSRIKARLQVGHARRYKSRMETLLDSGLYVEFYDTDGSVSAVLLADSAVIDDRTNDMCAYGDVTVHSDRNRTFVETSLLCYDNAGKLLHSDAWVRVVDSVKGSTLEGVGFQSDESLKNYTIYKVTGRVSAEE